MWSSYLDFNSEVIKKTGNSRRANGNDIRLVILDLIVLFSNFKLTTSSGKHLEGINRAHIVSVQTKPSAKDTDDLSIDLDRYRGTKRQDSTNNKKEKVDIIINLWSKMFLDLQNVNKKLQMI